MCLAVIQTSHWIKTFHFQYSCLFVMSFFFIKIYLWRTKISKCKDVSNFEELNCYCTNKTKHRNRHCWQSLQLSNIFYLFIYLWKGQGLLSSQINCKICQLSYLFYIYTILHSFIIHFRFVLFSYGATCHLTRLTVQGDMLEYNFFSLVTN